MMMMTTTIHHTMQSFYQIITTASQSKVILVQTMKGYEGLGILLNLSCPHLYWLL